MLRDTELLADGLRDLAALESLDLHGNAYLKDFQPLVDALAGSELLIKTH